MGDGGPLPGPKVSEGTCTGQTFWGVGDYFQVLQVSANDMYGTAYVSTYYTVLQTCSVVESRVVPIAILQGPMTIPQKAISPCCPPPPHITTHRQKGNMNSIKQAHLSLSLYVYVY